MKSQVQRQQIPSDRHKLQATLQNIWPRRVPQIIQMSSVECGAACLAMILSYYGRKTSVSEIREHCEIGRDGLSALHLVRVARDYGLRVRAISLRENDFRFVHLPAIVHWEFDHFLVVERWTKKFVDVIDPAAGRLHLTAEEFDTGFTGVVILLEPGTHFSRRRSSPSTDNHSLYHGALGNADILLTAARLLNEQQYQEALERIAAMLLDSIAASGWVTGVPLGIETPGLMSGLAGIGYGLLRLAEPENVPSVLLVSPPY